MKEILVAVLILSGSFYALAAAIGLVRFPEIYMRAHAATKPQTVGMILVMFAVALRVDESLGLIAVIMAFQLMTAPVAAHMVVRSAYRIGIVRHDLLYRDDLRQHDLDVEDPDLPDEPLAH